MPYHSHHGPRAALSARCRPYPGLVRLRQHSRAGPPPHAHPFSRAGLSPLATVTHRWASCTGRER